MRLAVLALFGLMCLCSGCDKSTATSPPALPVSNEPRQAQPKLQTLNLWIGAQELRTELALTPIQVQTGMMFRTNMAENEGMLFVFSVPHQASFWMKNTPLPLSAAYIDSQGKILEIYNLEPQNTNSVTASSDQVQYVLETKQGWFGRHNITPGTIIRTERGSLHDTFFGRR